MQKTTKVTLNIFRGYLQEKGLREAELLTSKLQKLNSQMHVCQLSYTSLNCYYILAIRNILTYILTILIGK